MDADSKSKLMAYSLAALQAFIGLTAILGGFELVIDPSGTKSNLPLEWLDSSPFPDYFIPGLLLFIVIGFGNALAAAGTFFRSKYAVHIALVLAACLILYMTVEVCFVGLQNLLQPTYFILGVILVVLGLKLPRTVKKAPEIWAESKMDELST